MRNSQILGGMKMSALALGVAIASGQVVASDDWMIEEVVVTAKKREQSLNDVSVAVNAVAADDIKSMRMSSPSDIAAIAPNVDFKSTLGGANPAITIRGIGLNDFNVNNNSSVGVYVDEVFVTSPAMMNFTMFDVGRIEVLKGPQGTLYGRNSNGGAINIVSAKPTEETEGYVTVGVGDYDMTEVEGVFGGALTDKLTGRVSFRYDDRDGYHENEVTGDDLGFNETQAIRAQLAYDNGSDFSANLTITHGEQDFGTIPFANYGVLDGSGNPCSNAAILANQCVNDQGYLRPDDDPYKHYMSAQEDDLFNDNETRTDMAVLTMNWDLGELDVTSITGWNRLDRSWAEGASDHDPAALTNATLDARSTGIVSSVNKEEDIEQVSQELRLSGDGDNYNWLVGAFYSRDDIATSNYADFKNLPMVGFDVVWDYGQDTESWALFSNGEIELTEELTLNLGLRYSEEERKFSGASYAYFDGLAVDVIDLFFAATVTPSSEAAATIASSAWASSESIDEEQVSGRIGLDYRPNNDLLVYGYVANGFKSGGFIGDFVFDQIAYEPYDSEELTAYEVGFKATLMESTMQLNGAVFYYDYKDMQTLSPVDTPAGTVFPLSNAEQAEVLGAELELQWLPIQGLELRGGLGYLDHELDDPGLGTNIPSTSDFQATAMARYEFSVTDGLMLALQADMKYTDSKFIEAFNMELLESGDYTVWNARASLFDDAGNWEVAAWGKNLGNEEYFGFGFDLSTFNGSAGYMYEAPRTYGLSLTYNY